MTAKIECGAHTFVCILACVLWKTLEQWTWLAGVGHTGRSVLDERAQIQSVDVVLPTTVARALRVRALVNPARAGAVARTPWPRTAASAAHSSTAVDAAVY